MLFSLFVVLAGVGWLMWETRGLTVRLPCGPLCAEERLAALARIHEAESRRQDRRLRAKLRTCTLAVSPFLLIVSLFPAILQYAVIQTPGPSGSFDCDDSTLWTIERLALFGIKARPLLGNLNKQGASYWESDHIWVVADIFGRWIALDWGSVRFDRPHYRGYTVSHDDLLFFVEQDRQRAGEASLPAMSSTK